MTMNFNLDPFQKEAIEWIQKNHSVLVTAPTGAGKTVVAEAAVDQALHHQVNIIYTAPIKALSNQKYRDFRARYGDDKVGILTGDVSINPDAPIVIMTTEIYRNSLFENSARIQKVGWIIFDEIHYLDDPERGTVWEEALLFTPETTHILALSATIPNIDELAEWIKSIHHRPLKVIKEDHRPVPLHILYQCQGKILDGVKRLLSEGFFNRADWRLSSRDHRRGFKHLRSTPNRLDQMLMHLKSRDRLPLIYFVFGRKRSQELAWEAAPYDFLNESERSRVVQLFQTLLNRYDLNEEKSAIAMRPLIEQGIAYHHAGMLPTLKEVVEQLFTSRLIKVIFTTETFALGINMPARSVVLDELEKYYGTGFKALTTRDFYQMAGRAGRRGLDTEGFVYARILPQHIAYQEVCRVIYGKPERVESQLNAAYATLLNLYRDLGKSLFDIYPRTFHYFQSSHKKRKEALTLIERKLDLLSEMNYLMPEGLSPKGEFASGIFGYELLLSEMHEDGVLDQLNESELSILLSSLVFEPRKGDFVPRLTKPQENLRKGVEHYSRHILRKENKYRIRPYTKLPHFHLAPAIEAWSWGAEFDDLFKIASVDEGELVRALRMIIQLLRELVQNPYSSERLKQTARQARQKINRGVVDAEKQLRV